MPRGGSLKLRIHSSNLGAEDVSLHPEGRAGQFGCLTVCDTGCGMDGDTLQRIFEPFFTTKAPGKGTGLGLATVHGIIKQHQGWVEVESTVGSGTTFRIYLPAVAAPPRVETERPKTACRGGTETILLVEDEEQVRRLATIALRFFGYEVIEAASGPEALRLWESHSPKISLVFSDMVMPGGLNGLDLFERLRPLKPDLKFIISSGYSSDLLHGARLPEGVKFLPKPYDPNALGNLIRESLDRKDQPALP
jgi:two-component system, cell cycle sensor histidine kinase and response regulator CckA